MEEDKRAEIQVDPTFKKRALSNDRLDLFMISERGKWKEAVWRDRLYGFKIKYGYLHI